MLFQFVREDLTGQIPQMAWIKNPFPDIPQPFTGPKKHSAKQSLLKAGARPLGSTIPEPSHLTRVIVPREMKTKTLAGHLQKSAKKKFLHFPEGVETPKGFYRSETPHFILYREGEEADEALLAAFEDLDSNILLDLLSFSPWAGDEKITIYLFKTPESYRMVTGRPEWSGGASSVEKRIIYLYQTQEAFSILAHELCHIYFDSFFQGGQPNPLWLSEGMATLIQVERGLAAPSWLRENLELLVQGRGMRFSDFLKVEETQRADDRSIRLWYAQAYSLVRFLVRLQHSTSFYNFCYYLRQGMSLTQAMHRSYGMPFNRPEALEYAWKGNLKSRALSRLP
ncbi:MAG: hypothetical protein HY400_03600 [Elusimicrobia bacterium]|nr:hypothetical protein [Elusimicrobiota bacterium]